MCENLNSFSAQTVNTISAHTPSPALKYVVQCAMPEETAPFYNMATKIENLNTPYQGMRADVITWDEKEILLITSGIGLVAAASATQWAIDCFKPKLVISAGTAGGLANDINVGEVAVSKALGYGNADATDFGYVYGQVPGQPVDFPVPLHLVTAAIANNDLSTLIVKAGRMLSGDTFVTAKNVDIYRKRFPDAISTDMESCAIAQVCYAHAIEFISVRGISDLCGPQAGQDHHLAVDETSNRSAIVVQRILSAQ